MDFLKIVNVNYDILIVEDNIADARLIEEYLSEHMIINDYFSYSLTHFKTLKEGIKVAGQKKFDIVLLDLSLPDSAGLKTFQIFHEANPDTPVIILSGYERSDLEIQAVHYGAQDYLVKGTITGNLLFRSMQYAVERQRLMGELHALSLRDELTGLYNRRGFDTLSEQQIKNAHRNKENVVLFFLDLDNMKTINDELGHSFGDMAIVEAAGLLENTLRESDIVARIGGDEFAALTLASNQDAANLKDRLFENLKDLNQNPDRQFQLQFSVGVEISYADNPVSLQVLLDAADEHMYEEKLKNKGKKVRGNYREAA